MINVHEKRTKINPYVTVRDIKVKGICMEVKVEVEIRNKASDNSKRAHSTNL